MEQLKDRYGILTTQNEIKDLQKADILFLSVKPQSLSQVMEKIANQLSPQTLLISILAGIPLNRIEDYFSKPAPIVRVMPNMGALVRKSVSAVCFNEQVGEKDREWTQKIFQCIGSVYTVSEKELDAVTAISGSGPAYVFYFLENFVEAAKNLGFDEQKAQKFCLETLNGANDLLLHSKDSASDLRKKVTSKGGTTEAALKVFQDENFSNLFIKAVQAAFERSKELGEQ